MALIQTRMAGAAFTWYRSLSAGDLKALIDRIRAEAQRVKKTYARRNYCGDR